VSASSYENSRFDAPQAIKPLRFDFDSVVPPGQSALPRVGDFAMITAHAARA